MRKGSLWKTAAVAATALIAVCAPVILQFEKASADTWSEFPCTYTAAPKDTEYMCYGSSAVNTYTADEAAAAGIPEGYTGSVLEVVPLSGGTSSGVLLDFYASQIPIDFMESITFRVYLGAHASNTGGKPQIRIAKPNNVNDAWVWQPGETPTTTEEWTEVTVPTTETNFDSLVKDGYLNKFELSVRSNAQIPFYIDSITPNMEEGYAPPEVDESDKEAPVINLNVTEIHVTTGTVPMLNATATDNSGNATLSYAWSEGALDEYGKLTAGTHTWTVTAKDPSGNTAEKVVTVIVTDEEDLGDNVVDEENTSEKYTVTFDGENAQSYTYGWKVTKPEDPTKEGEGITYTFIGWYHGDAEWDFATDVVTGDLNLVSKWSEEVSSYTVTFDGKNGKIYEYGSKLEKPADPTKESTVQYTYTFDGWYNGDVKWNFDTDAVYSDLALVAKFTETKRVYVITFDGENGAEYYYGDKIEKPADPTKEGHEFVAWYKGTLKWDFEKYTVTGDMDLTARWKEVEGAASDDNVAADVTEQDGGCGGVIGASAVGLTFIGVAAVCLKKKED
ncbi:MAG: InlB B-repeat-containing protein [Clostridia bacterium]|nr:InlB B-repeat-containing protein [Clostridia bacterium]